jgi:hypothetical protein
MTNETLKSLINAYTGDDVASYVTDVLDEDRELRRKVALIRQDEKSTRETYVTAVAKHQAEMAIIQRRCPHHETTFHDDPSGGNGSYYDCKLCGREVRPLRAYSPELL